MQYREPFRLVISAVFVLLGYLAGSSCEAVAKTVGRDITAVAVVIAISAAVVWRVRSARRKRQPVRTPHDHG